MNLRKLLFLSVVIVAFAASNLNCNRQPETSPETQHIDTSIDSSSGGEPLEFNQMPSELGGESE